VRASLRLAIEAALGSVVTGASRATGGSINEAWIARLADGRRLFVKTRDGASEDTFHVEARGLAWLRSGLDPSEHGLTVPETLAVLDAPRALVLEAFEPGHGGTSSDEALGRGLAQLHRSLPQGTAPGLDHDGDLATLRLPNAPTSDWATFYGERRLRPLLAMAEARGATSRVMRTGVEEVIARLPELVGAPEPMARLHGDLWSGNAAVDAKGRPTIFDPAVFAGHREVDLAMMRLFGGFSARVFAAYEETWPLTPGWERRVALYQLLPLLAHAALFGGGYVSAVESRLARVLAR
jgi:fructosamine-3-kinase